MLGEGRREGSRKQETSKEETRQIKRDHYKLLTYSFQRSERVEW